MVPILIVVMLFGGFVAGAIAYSKTEQASSFVAFFILGALFPLIGIILAALSKPGAPAGKVAVTCPTCSARQNIDSGQVEWECWQCHTGWHLPARAGQA